LTSAGRPEILLADGSLRGAWRTLVVNPVVIGLLGLLVATAMFVLDPEMRSEGWWPVMFIALLGAAIGAAVSLYFLVPWALLPARVSYHVRGSELIVRRGGRVVRRVDLSDASEIHVVGGISGRRLWIGWGRDSSPLADLPHVVYLRRAVSGRETAVLLPRVLVWGQDAADEIRTRLFAELLAVGISPTVLVAGRASVPSTHR
jgi:hypothetical protein